MDRIITNMMSTLSHIKKLCARPCVSKIHGVGLKAIRHIYKGEQLFPAHFPSGEWVHKHKLQNLYISDNTINMLQDFYCCETKGPSMVFCPTYQEGLLLQSFMNHEEDANTRLINGYTVATKDIMEGDEITENYFDICGAEYCRTKFNLK